VCAGNPLLRPRVSIVTTVYDRVACLADCIRSVRRLRFQDYEHIMVSDCPPAAIVDEIGALVRSFADERLSYVNLDERHNNWGIAPAAVGLRRTRGDYVCFLSDDNGYTPDHVGTLVAALDRDPTLGFVYSSCRYAGRLVLRHPVPAPARIDLGQPMFRRELFRTHLGDDLPFQMMAWDWALIDTLVRRGVAWKHVDVPSFIFRLAHYPHLAAQA
jgi:GT2 family glycosyltransferase